jgi:hypothetical protein
VVDIGDDLFAIDTGYRRYDQGVAGGHFENLAGEFAPVGQHVAAKHRDADALEPIGLRTRAIGGDKLR